MCSADNFYFLFFSLAISVSVFDTFSVRSYIFGPVLTPWGLQSIIFLVVVRANRKRFYEI